MKSFLFTCFLCTLSLFTQADPPNILLIMVDDMGWNDVGANTFPSTQNPGPPPASVSSGTQLPPPNPAWDSVNGMSLTPRIDSLSTDGIRMTRFLSTASVCSPTRAALLTGAYPRRVRMESVIGPYGDVRAEIGLNSAEVTLPERLREAGYLTAMSGKWHLGHRPDFMPTRHGFSRFLGILYSNDMWTGNPYATVNWPNLFLMREEQPLSSYTTGTGHVISGAIDTDAEQSVLLEAMTEEALAVIDEATTAGKPFFVYYSPHAPHVPVFPHPDFLSTAGQTDPVARYQDMIAELDHRVGQLLDKLQSNGIAGETIVIFTSDNGPWHTRKSPSSPEQGAGSAYPFRGSKNGTWEGGHRVPFLARYPGHFSSGQVLHQHASTMDLFSTLLALAGVSVPADRVIDGQDLSPLLTGSSSAEVHPHFYYYETGADNAIGVLESTATDNWKLRDNALYNLSPGFSGDFQESTNAAAANPSDTSRLQNALSAWNQGMNPRGRLDAQAVQIELESDQIFVPETGQATARVRLSASDTRSVTVSFFSGDRDLKIIGNTTLDFTAANWNQWQDITFSFEGDPDLISSGATFRVLSNGLHLRELFVFEEDTLQVSPPVISRVWPKGNRVAVVSNGSLVLEAAASDDGSPQALSTGWSTVSGPDTVIYNQTEGSRTQARFPSNGEYLLRFTADDGLSSRSFDLEVLAGLPAAPGTSLQIHEPLDGQLNGNLQGSGSSWTEGRIDSALRLSGLEETWVDTASVSVSEANQLSITAWIRLQQMPSEKSRVIAQQLDGGGAGRSWLSVTPAGALFTYAGGAPMEGGNIPLNQWVHVAVTAGNNEIKLWVNGIEVAQRNAGIESNTAGFRFGHFKNQDIRTQWVGDLDDLRIYTRRLPDTELQLIMGYANQAPVVNTGASAKGKTGVALALAGSVSDDGGPSTLNTTWQADPGTAVFTDPSSPATSVTFSEAAEYELKLQSHDGHALAENTQIWRVIKDQDDDGMDDDWESDYGVNDPDADDDLDGIKNVDEFKSATHPGDANSLLRTRSLRLLPSGMLELEWDSAQDSPAPWPVTYRVWQTSNLLAPVQWSEVATEIPADGESTRLELPPGPGPANYIRVEAL